MTELLSMSHCTLKFGGLTAVNNFNLSLKEGELVGLIGPNGAGKTCIFNLLTGIYKPEKRPANYDAEKSSRNYEAENRHPQQVIFFNNFDVTKLQPFKINQLGIARTFQNIRLFNSLSVLENVRMGFHHYLKHGSLEAVLRTRDYFVEEEIIYKDCLNLLKMFGLEGFEKEKAKHLPYGEQRRLEIVRALATRPRLLLLDEPAAGMNTQEKRELKELLKKIRKEFNLTILLIEHDMPVVMDLCERIVVLDHGETIATGKPEEVRGNPKVIEAYLGQPNV